MQSKVYTGFQPKKQPYSANNRIAATPKPRLIQGADADLLLDDLLIDVKTTKDFSLKPRDWHQLIGYVALNQHFPIGGGTAPVAINHIGIYFARHNHLETWPLSDVVDASKLAAFATWPMDYLIEQDAIRVTQAQEFEQRDTAVTVRATTAEVRAASWGRPHRCHGIGTSTTPAYRQYQHFAPIAGLQLEKFAL